MKTRIALFMLLFAGIVMMVWLWIHRLPQSQKRPVIARSETDFVDGRSSAERAKANETANHQETSALAEVPQNIPTYHLDRTTITSDPNDEARLRKVQPFQLRGGGSSAAKITDLEGNTVLEPYPYNTIASCSVSPSGGRVLVYHGNADYEIFEPASKVRAVLPQQPPGEKKLAFSAWHWVDDDLLLGASGDELSDRKEVAGEDTMAIQGRLYLYSIRHRTLAEVQLPKDLGAKAFSVTQVTQNGYVRLISEDSNATPPAYLGWFKVRPK